MLSKVCPIMLLAVFAASAADVPLPGLRVEAVDGGSVLYVKNTLDRPLTSYLIELVGYPGSSYSLWKDDPAVPISPGVELRIPIVNMTVGAAPEYVKITAAIYADGSLAGAPAKSSQFLERRKFVIGTARELAGRIAKDGADQKALIAGLKQWSESLPPAVKPRRATQESINQAAGRELIAAACTRLEKEPAAAVAASFKSMADMLAAAKPAL